MGVEKIQVADFFFRAEGGIRDGHVTGVQTCALPISQRLGAVAPTIESGCCYLPLGAPWLDDFIEEMSGATKHDDQMDTTAYALIDLNVKAPTGVIRSEERRVGKEWSGLRRW